jgi:hypothetical protein
MRYGQLCREAAARAKQGQGSTEGSLRDRAYARLSDTEMGKRALLFAMMLLRCEGATGPAGAGTNPRSERVKPVPT